MDRQLSKSIKEAEDACAGLQLFLDALPEHHTEIHTSIQELVSLAHGLEDLRSDVTQIVSSRHRISRLLESDVYLLLKSMQLTLDRVQTMFANTRFETLSRGRPYAQAWDDLDLDLRDAEGGLGLRSRLEVYSVFLQDVLAELAGAEVEAGALDRYRDRISKLLAKQEPQSFANNPPPRSSTPSRFQPPPIPGVRPYPTTATMQGPWMDDWERSPFPPVPTPPFGSHSPTLSNASQFTHTSSHTSTSSGAYVPHWAGYVFNRRSSTTKFRPSTRERSVCYGPPLPRAVERLNIENFVAVSRFAFQNNEIEIRFYWRPTDGRSRILLIRFDPLSPPATFCIPLTALKLCRSGSSIDLYRLDREHNTYDIWAKLAFADYERLVLFYCTFCAMKNQDDIPPTDGLEAEYFYTEREEETPKFSGLTTYSGSYIHALRIFYDRSSGGIRLEARAYRGTKKHVPIWTAFITRYVDKDDWMFRLSPRKIELRRLEQHVFTDGYAPPRTRSGRFVIEFREENDATDFMLAVRDFSSVI